MVPATEYNVGAIGLAEYVVPFVVPGYHVYVCAPDAVMVTIPPEQATEDEATMLMVGLGFVFTATVAVPKHVPLLAVTV